MSPELSVAGYICRRLVSNLFHRRGPAAAKLPSMYLLSQTITKRQIDILTHDTEKGAGGGGQGKQNGREPLPVFEQDYNSVRWHIITNSLAHSHTHGA